MDAYELLAACTAFEWDTGNLLKNWEKHRVSGEECEQVFFNKPLIAAPDPAHPRKESRYYVLGQTDSGRRLFVVFAIRGHNIRVISARDMSQKERIIYEAHE